MVFIILKYYFMQFYFINFLKFFLILLILKFLRTKYEIKIQNYIFIKNVEYLNQF